MLVDKGSSSRPERREGASVIKDVHVKAILHTVVSHEAKDVIVNVAEEMNLGSGISDGSWRNDHGCTDVGLDSPIPVELLQTWVFVKESTVPSTHVAVADHPSFAHSNCT